MWVMPVLAIELNLIEIQSVGILKIYHRKNVRFLFIISDSKKHYKINIFQIHIFQTISILYNKSY
jgi:hypothetical protein